MKDANINKIICNNIKKYRKQEKISIIKLSKLSRINIKKLIKIEKNMTDINIEELYRISIILNISIDNFFKGKI